MPLSIKIVQDRISAAAADARRGSDKIRLLAVSKTHSADSIRAAYNAGLREFGENYADELAEKSASLADLPDIRLVFIGQLQSNKIQKIVKHADEIQSVASEKHARYIERYVSESGKNNFPVWIVINAGNEDAKRGVTFDELPALSAFIQKNCPHLKLQGVMAIPPAEYSDDAWQKHSGREIPDLYKKLRAAASATGSGLLSLGMSSDLNLAIAAGSDCIRIGTAIFGKRQP